MLITASCKKYTILFVFLLGIAGFNVGCATVPSIIPQPQQLSVEPGSFTIDSSTKIYLASNNPDELDKLLPLRKLHLQILRVVFYQEAT